MTSSRPSAPGEISGVSLIDGEPAELVDAHWLFANHVGAAAGAAEQLVCRLPDDDPWMQNMLRPIVEAAGYRVVGESDEVDGRPGRSPPHGAKVDKAAARAIRLRTEPEPQGRRMTASTATTAPAC